MSGFIHGRELSPDGALGAETNLRISRVQEVREAPSHMEQCLVKMFWDERTYRVEQSRDDIADQQTAFLKKQNEELAAKYGRRWSRF